MVEQASRKVAEYIYHREARERQILDTLRQCGRSTSLQLTRAIYPAVPAKVFFAAHSNVRSHLYSMQQRGQVQLAFWELWSAASSKESPPGDQAD